MSTQWRSVLSLDHNRAIVAGSESDLASAISRAADLRIYTEFIYNEHLDITSTDTQPVLEVSEFAVTYVLQKRWVAGIMSLRQPIEPPDRFGPRPSMSFFLYNQNGQQAIARPYLDGIPPKGVPGESAPIKPEGMPKYHTSSSWDAQTNAPSTNFVYEFGAYRYCVWDAWKEVFAHDQHGQVVSGSLDALIDAFVQGAEIKVGVSNLCSSLAENAIEHEVFVRVGPGYYCSGSRLFSAGSHPLVRVRPAVPMLYTSNGWDFGWLMLRTDGQIQYRRCDPYTLRFTDMPLQCGIRWFVR